MVRYQGWGEVSPEEFGHFLHLERPLLPLVLRILADRWQTLQKENAPLRAIVNGRVRSVAETFYDDLIRRHLPAGETGIAMVIGEVLGRECPGIGDGPGGPGAVLQLGGREGVSRSKADQHTRQREHAARCGEQRAAF